MKFYIGSALLIDDVIYGENIKFRGMFGGGAYALAGASLWTKSVSLVSVLDERYALRIKEWLVNNDLDTEQIKEIDKDLPVNQLSYEKDGKRSEIHHFSKEYLNVFDYTLQNFLEHSQEECGIYLFRNVSDKFWVPFLELENKKATVLWRLAHDACKPEYIPRIIEISSNVSIIAITYSDAQDLYNTSQYSEILTNLKQLESKLVILLNVESGMLFIQNGQEVFIPFYSQEEIVDATGGDSGASAAALVGYCQEKNIFEIGYMSNHSRLFCTEQFGLPDSIEEYRNRNHIR